MSIRSRLFVLLLPGFACFAPTRTNSEQATEGSDATATSGSSGDASSNPSETSAGATTSPGTVGPGSTGADTSDDGEQGSSDTGGNTSSAADGESSDAGGRTTTDDGSTSADDSDSASTTEALPCPDGVVDAGEDCDDDNAVPGDGCTGCAIDPGYTCGGAPSACTPNVCDPLLQDCAEGTGCYAASDLWLCLDDVNGAVGGQGDDCAEHADCNPGLVCGTPEQLAGCEGDDGCCTVLCDVDFPSCPTGLECAPWYRDGDPAPPGYEATGLCIDAS